MTAEQTPAFRGQITLDGPSGTGKSSVARDVARKLGAAYLDTGAMYRAAGLAADPTRARIDLDDDRVLLDGEDVTRLIRTPEASDRASRVAADPAVRRGLRCGPLSVPSHKLVPDARWLLDRPDGAVIARSDTSALPQTAGVAVYVHGRTALLRQALVQEGDDPAIQRPLPGFRRVAVSEHHSAYVRCR